jgi:hypothetical protein
MTDSSNLQLKSNLMIDDGTKNQTHYFPGDFAAHIQPHRMRDKRIRKQYFKPHQIHEYEQTLVCLICKRPCAGTCELVP